MGFAALYPSYGAVIVSVMRQRRFVDLLPRFPHKPALQFRRAGQPRRRQWPLVDRPSRVFEVLHRRIAEEHRRDRVARDDETQARLDQAVGVALADERLEALGAGDVGVVAAAGADRVGWGRAERVPLGAARERAAG